MTQEPSTTNSDYLRLMITEAVNREVSAQIALHRQQVQIVDGKATQLNRDYINLDQRLKELREIVIGDPELSREGLIARIASIEKRIDDAIRAATDPIKTQIAALDTSLKKIVDDHEARTNQIKGVKWALYVIGAVLSYFGVTNLAALVDRFAGA